VSQAERWQSVPMQPARRVWRGQIPAEALASPYPMAYYFEFAAAGQAGLYPSLGPSLTDCPYFVVRRAAGA
jgi:hypothetical protein